jgi:SPP1 family predicted phage head-tail adaptor
MTIADMRNRIVIEQKTETRGTSGGVVPNWTTLDTVWAEEIASRGREFFAARGLIAEKNTVFRIRYRADVTAKHRIQFDGRIWNIVDTIAEKGQRRSMLIYCTAGAVPGGA